MGLSFHLGNSESHNKSKGPIVSLFQAAVLSSAHGQRALSPGRVVTINTAEHKNAPAMILQTGNGSSQSYSTRQPQSVSSPNEKKFQVLVICDADPETTVTPGE